MQFSTGSTSSTVTHEEYFAGASATPSYGQWTPSLSLSFAIASGSHGVERTVLFGWNEPWVTEGLVIDFGEPTDHWVLVGIANDSEGTAGHETPRRVEREIEIAPLDLAFVDKVVQEGREQCSKLALATLIQNLKRLMRLQLFSIIDQILAERPWDQLSPEAMIAFLRVTSPVKSNLAEWRPSLHAVRAELETRRLNAAALLEGLR